MDHIYMKDYSKDLENRVLTLENRMDAFDEERIRADERRRVRAQAKTETPARAATLPGRTETNKLRNVPVTEIIAVLAPVLRWLIMKKDSELPWVVRLSRWVLALCGSALAVLFVAHCFKEWFL